MRVVSLVPSATETLLAWGIEPVACTRFCEQPALRHVGGTKDPDLAAVLDLAPDLVVMCEEENRKEDADALRAAGAELFVFDIDAVDEVGEQLRELAAAVGIEPPPFEVPRSEPAHGSTAFVPIWRRPWMTMNGSTYGSSVLAHLGIDNVFADDATRYPETTLEEATTRAPTRVLAPSEPYPFSERHRGELQGVAPVTFVDGQDLFWWGARTPAALHRLTDTVGD